VAFAAAADCGLGFRCHRSAKETMNRRPP
jgi:hypothetical protein